MQSQNNSSTGCFKSILKISIWGVIILMVICGLASSPQEHPNEKPTKNLKSEWSRIELFPGAKEISMINPYFRSRTKLISMYAKYATDKNSSEVRTFYLEQAQKNGWTIVQEELIKATEKEPNEKFYISFKKDEGVFFVSYSVFKDLDGSNLYVKMNQSVPPSK